MSPTGSRRVIGLVAGRELRERLRAKSYYLFTGLLVAMILAAGVIARVADDEPSPLRLVAVDVAADFAGTVDLTAASLGREVEVTSAESVDAARRAVEDGDADIAILGADGTLLFDGDLDDETEAVAQLAWTNSQVRQSLLGRGLTPEQLVEAFTVAPLAAASLDGEDDSSDGLALLTGTVTAVLLFISLQTFGGQYVLMGVVEEKSTAVVEVLLARIRADQLLAGKVIGIGVAALLQFVAAVAAGLAALAISGTDVPGAVWSALPVAVLWFLGGYALYSTLYALAGSLVSRQEDAQSAAAPIMTAMIVAYALIYVFGYAPESTTSTVLSLLPPSAPFLMPMRMAAGAASVVEVAVAIGLLAASVVLTAKLAGRIYEQVVLRRGSRIAWAEALRLGR